MRSAGTSWQPKNILNVILIRQRPTLPTLEHGYSLVSRKHTQILFYSILFLFFFFCGDSRDQTWVFIQLNYNCFLNKYSLSPSCGPGCCEMLGCHRWTRHRCLSQGILPVEGEMKTPPSIIWCSKCHNRGLLGKRGGGDEDSENWRDHFLLSPEM